MGLALNMSIVTAIGLGLSLSLLPLLDEPDKPTPVQPLSISMSLAVQTAEALAPGQAIHAQLGIVQGRPVYEIDMLGLDQRLNKVQVGAEDGNVAVVMTENEAREEHKRNDEKGRSYMNFNSLFHVGTSTTILPSFGGVQ